ncbi:hypothetical protein L1987_20208 [Smallanthus sonchifolius]|uniref:Uncharacterized protein n=1 Tax=Smallanthus sonchifolius TaxID=185202 RepID=A0ACB9IRY3_9ASTR|nr:hypothetical protein L1987_20208 [Smallanthus sonchifolius]
MRLCKSRLNKQDAAKRVVIEVEAFKGEPGTSEDGSMRDQRSVAQRRITIGLDKCYELEGTGYEIERESLDHKCEYDHDKEIEIERDEIGSQTKKPIRVTSMESCVTFLDMLHIHSFVMKHKEALEIDFEKLVKWFINKVLNIQSEKPFAPKLSNCVEVKLLKLYMLVKEEGGYSKWYYIKTKKNKINIRESSSSGESKFKKRRVSMVNKQEKDEMNGEESKGHKEESENEYVVVEDSKAKGLESHEEWDSKSSRTEEDGVPSEKRSRDDRLRVRPEGNMAGPSNLGLNLKRRSMRLCKSRLNKQDAAKRVVGEVEAFMGESGVRVNETKTEKCSFSNNKVRENVTRGSSVTEKSRRGSFGQTSEDGSMRDQKSVAQRRITIGLENRCLDLDTCEKIMAKKYTNMKGFNCHASKFLHTFVPKYLDELEGRGYEIERESLDHKCEYDQDKEIEIERDKNGSQNKKPIRVTSMESCVTFLDMLHIHSFVMKHKEALEIDFENLVKWFINKVLNIQSEKPFAPKLSNCVEVKLLKLYMLVKEEGGYSKWYYIKTKKNKINIRESSSSGESKFKKRRVSMVNKQEKDEMNGEESKGHKEESENEDVVVEDSKAKGLESHEEWDSKSSRTEEDGVPSEKRSRDDRLRVRPEGNMAGPSNLGLNLKRRSMRLCKSRLNKQDAAKRVVGEVEAFMGEPGVRVNETKTEKCSFSNNKVRENVTRGSSVTEKSRRGSFGQTSEDGSMRDQKSVAQRRITIGLENRCLDLDTCEKIMAKKYTNMKGFNCHASKFLHTFVPKYLDELEGTGYEIERESLDHKCEYDQDKEIEIERDKNGSQNKKPIRVTSMESCVTFLDMLHIHSFVMKHKEALEIDFENLVKWFINKVLNIQSEKLFAPKLSNCVEVKLLKLYMLVKEEGGYSKWYYIKTKKNKINIRESSSSGESKFKKRRVSMVNKQEKDEMNGEESKGHKEESENEDVVVEDSKAKGLESHEEWDSKSSRTEEDGVPSEKRSRDDRLRVRPEGNMAGPSNLGLNLKRRSMRLCKSRLNKQDAPKRVVGEVEAFKGEPGVRVNETKTEKCSFSNNKVRENVTRGSSVTEKSRRGSFGQTSEDGSMRDQKSVAQRRITIGLENRCLDLDTCEKIMAKKYTNMKGFNCHASKFLHTFVPKYLDELEGTGYEIERESLDHMCEYDQDKEIEIERDKNGSQNKKPIRVTSMESCVTFIDMLHIHSFVMKHKEALEIDFENLVKWFINKVLNIQSEKPFAPKLSNCVEVKLLKLYMLVKEERGYSKWYYIKTKKNKINIRESSSSGESKFKKRRVSMVNKQEKDEMNGEESKGHKEESENEDVVVEDSNRTEEDGVPSEKRSRDDRLRVRPEGNMAGPSNLGLNLKRRSMRLCKSRLNKQDAAKRVVGEVEAFKGELGVTEKSRRGSFGQTSEDGSLRDQKSVAQRRITIGLENRCLDLDTCEKIMAKKYTNMKGFNCHASKFLHTFVPKYLDELEGTGYEIERESLDHKCEYDQDKEIEIERDKNGSQNKKPIRVTSMESCLTFLDMLHIHSFVMKHKEALEIDFEKLVKWFINKVLNIQSEKPFAPKLSNCVEVKLLKLYMLVKEEGGYSKVSKESKWALIARKFGMGTKSQRRIDEMNGEESKGHKEESENEDVVVEDSKAKGLESHEEWDSKSSRTEEDGVPSEKRSRDDRLRVRPEGNMAGPSNLGLNFKRRSMRLCKSRLNKQDAAKRVVGEVEAFKGEPGVRVNETKTEKCSFSNNKVRENVTRGSSVTEKSRRGSFGQTSEDGSMRDQKSVAQRRITIGLENRCLDLDTCEKIMAKKYTNMKGFNCHASKFLHTFVPKYLDELEGTGYEIERESLDHKCEYDQDKEIEIERDKNGSQNKKPIRVTSMESCVTFLDMLHIHSFVMKHKEALEIDFENLVKWFINKVLNIQSEKPFAPKLSNCVEVKLLKLYMLVKEEGGYSKWYYIKTKKKKINIRESSSSGESKFKKRRVSMVNKQEKDEMNGEESKGHKEESENEDVVVEDSKAKGLESHEEWDSKSSRTEEDGVPSEKRSRDDRLRVRPEGNMAGPSNLGLNLKRRSMRLCKSRLNKQDAAKRVVGEVEAFKGEPGVTEKSRRGSFGQTSEDGSLRDQKSVAQRRITIGLENRCLDLDTCEKIMAKKYTNMKGFNCHASKFLHTFVPKYLDELEGTGYEIERESLDHKCEYDQDKEIEIERDKNGSQNKKPIRVTSMESCLTFLDMLHIHSFVMKHKEALEIDFEKLVKWFINKVLNIQSEKPFAPKLSNCVEVKLLKLYMLVKEEGGYSKWYYIKTKKNKINIRESSSSGESKFKKRRVSMVNKQEEDEMNGEESKGHKEESENEDVVVEDSKAKGLESHEEWDSKSSRTEEDGVPSEKRSRDDRLRVRPEGNMAGPSNLGLNLKRRSMRLCKSRLNKQDAAKRVVGEVEAFKGEPGVRVNETKTEKCSFSNNKVRENVTRGSSVTEKSRRGSFGQTSEDGSMRDQKSVVQRRITIGLENRCLDLDTCEKIMAKKYTNMKGFNCHASKFLHTFVPKYLDELEGTGYEIERESLDHKCEYDQDKEIEIERDKNGSQNKKPIRVTSMESCLTFLDMLHIHSFVMKHKEALEIDFEKLVKWFINKVLNIQSEKPFAPKLSNCVEVKLLKLYMLVKEEGGYSKWYYIKTKKNKINIRESSSSGESKFKKRRVSMVNKQEKDEMNGEESKGHKEESENEDVVVEDSKAKGLESHEEWDSKSSRTEEDGVPSEKRSRDDRLRVRPEGNMAGPSNLGLNLKRRSMRLCKSRLNKQDAAKRVVGEVEAFKGEPGVRVNETKTEKCSFSNNKVRENVTRGSSVTEKSRRGSFGQTSEDGSMRDQKSVA